MVTVARTRGRRSLPRRVWALALMLGLLVGASGLMVAPFVHAASGTYPPLTGSVNGPSALGINTAHYYRLDATGGPAFALNGTQVGNLTFYASLVAPNTSAPSLNPTFGAIVNGSYNVSLSAGNVSQVVDLQVEYVSIYHQLNVTLNVTYVVQVVHPYVVTGIIQAGNDTVLAFPIQVSLDGQVVSPPLEVPTLTPYEEYNFSYDYVTAGLSSGYHTFTFTLPTQHGQVHFAGGALSYQYTFYVPGPPADYTLYYMLGGVALVGVILIFLVLVGARRRGGSRS